MVVNDYTTILGTTMPWVIGEHYAGTEVDIDGQLYPDQSFVVLRQGLLTEWLRQVWKRGKSPTPEPHQVDGHYYLVQFDSEPPWLESDANVHYKAPAAGYRRLPHAWNS
jgi:hypothetical protein